MTSPPGFFNDPWHRDLHRELRFAVKLTGADNLEKWQSNTRRLLGEDLVPFVAGETTRPVHDPEEKSDVRALRTAAWTLNHSKACYLIAQTVPDYIAARMVGMSARQRWVYCEELFISESDRFARQVKAYKAWMEVEFDGKRLRRFVDDYMEIVNDCIEAGVEIGRKVVLFRFLELIAPHEPAFHQECTNDIFSMMMREGVEHPDVKYIYERAASFYSWGGSQSSDGGSHSSSSVD